MLGIFPLQLILYTRKILSVHSPAAFQTLFRLSELRPLAFPKPIPCQYEQASWLAYKPRLSKSQTFPAGTEKQVKFATLASNRAQATEHKNHEQDNLPKMLVPQKQQNHDVIKLSKIPESFLTCHFFVQPVKLRIHASYLTPQLLGNRGLPHPTN